MSRYLTAEEMNLLEAIEELGLRMLQYASTLGPLPNPFFDRVDAAFFDLRAVIALAALEREEDR